MDKKIKKIFTFLRNRFPKAACELNHKNNYELLIAVILSAQCTDKRVNLITKDLFKKYPDIRKMADANLFELENEIKSCGFYHNKAKNIISACKEIVNEYNGEIPSDFDKLVKLKGVGRKTANVVISVGFGGDAIAVDTHVFRVSKRLALANEKTPEKVELQLQKIVDKKFWTEMHYLMVLFGRYICKSQRPLCEECQLKDICNYYQKEVKKRG